MLYVANAARPELALPTPSPTLLWIGGALGVGAIPLYALGYRQAAAMVSPRFASYARVISSAGVLGSLIGAVIHGCTAVFIRDGLASGAPANDPIVVIASSPSLSR